MAAGTLADPSAAATMALASAAVPCVHTFVSEKGYTQEELMYV